MLNTMVRTFSIGAAIFSISMPASASLFNSKPESSNEKANYAIGYDIGYSYSNVNNLVDVDMISEGIKDGLTKKDPAVSQKEMADAMAEFRKDINKKLVADAKQRAENNKKESAKFMKKVASMNGVKMLDDGVYYHVEKSGNGPKPDMKDKVTIQYQGKLANGDVFYDTFKFKANETFMVSTTIPGWKKVFTNMPVGSTWIVYLAPEQAFGANGSSLVGPNQAVEYKIKLISANK